jgi:hypothetical protein
MGLWISHASSLEDLPSPFLLFGLRIHDRYGVLFYHIPEYLLLSPQCHALMHGGVSYLSLLNHLYQVSWTSLKTITLGKERWISLAFLGSAILVPGLITFATLFKKNVEWFAGALALSNAGTGDSW